MSRLRPLFDAVIIRRAAPAKQIGLIHVPDAYQQRRAYGEVIACGAGKRMRSGALCPLDVSPGNVVVFDQYEGAEIRFQGSDEELWLLREYEILARVIDGSVEPIGDVVAIIPDEVHHTGRIIIPDTAKQKDGRLREAETATGTVVAVGPGTIEQIVMKQARLWKNERVAVELTVGDRVLYRARLQAHMAYTTWKNRDGREVVLLHAGPPVYDVFGKIEEAA